jgi:hypothetical protein
VTKPLQTFHALVAFVLVLGTAAVAQEKPTAKEIVPLKVQVVISRYQGDKKVSSLPYTVSVNANDILDGRPRNSSLRMGAQVPVATISVSVVDGKAVTPESYQYKDIGTNIDCNATTTDNVYFRLAITIDDTSVIAGEGNLQQGLAKNQASFRTFRSNESLFLKDGQSQQFTTATDKVTGEVVKVDVTLTVVK